MNQKKLLVSDYDQTFYIDQIDVEKNIKAVSKLRSSGNLFCIATGSSYVDLKNKEKRHSSMQYDYLIIDHGATILNGKDEILFTSAIEKSIIKDIIKDLKGKGEYKYICYSRLEKHVSENYDFITKINCRYQDDHDALEIKKKIEEKYKDQITIYYTSTGEIEIISKKVSKIKAIYYLLKDINIPKDAIYTIGDGYSDIEMIDTFNGFCVEDSKQEVKQVSKKECRSVTELIEKYFL